MTTRISYERLIEIVDGDRDLVVILVEEGVIVEREGFTCSDVDRVLASRTLVREFNVNLAGVDIILRLREKLARARMRLQEDLSRVDDND